MPPTEAARDRCFDGAGAALNGKVLARVRVEIATVSHDGGGEQQDLQRDGLVVEERRERKGDEGLQQLDLRHPRDAAHRQPRVPGEEPDPLREQRDIEQPEPWF
jgi:hypothetical protein